jgi:hypothetical protein
VRQTTESFTGPPAPEEPDADSAAEELPAPAVHSPRGSRRGRLWPVLLLLLLLGSAPLLILTWKREGAQLEPLLKADVRTADRGALLDTAPARQQEAAVAERKDASAAGSGRLPEAVAASDSGTPATTGSLFAADAAADRPVHPPSRQ